MKKKNGNLSGDPHWWAKKDPRKSLMYFCYWALNAWMTFTLALSLFGSGLMGVNLVLPQHVWIMYGMFFSTMLIIWSRALRILRSKGCIIPEENIPDTKEAKNTKLKEAVKGSFTLKQINRFPGWFCVWLPWVFAWHQSLFAQYSNAIYSQAVSNAANQVVKKIFFIPIPQDVIFQANTWLWFLGIITLVFIISDAARERLARQVEGYVDTLCSIVLAKLAGKYLNKDILEKIITAKESKILKD